MTFGRFVLKSAGAAALALLATGGSALAAGSPSAAQQRAAGAAAYSANCSSCHGAALQGGTGPVLHGAAFAQSYPTAGALFDFVHKQMPLTAPGSLSTTQYLSIVAYLSSKNGASLKAPLTVGNAGSVHLGAAAAAAATEENPKGASTIEIVRAAPTTHTVFGALPSGANLDVTDAMLSGAASDSNDWLMGGQSYTNDRYSSLDQISTSNVASLMPVALVQTGMTASFEATPVVVSGIMYLSTPVVDDKMKVLAVDATNGARIWETTIGLGAHLICCGPVNRGVAVAYGKVYVLTLDDRLIALDARDGSTAFDVHVADPKVGYSETMTPAIYDGHVIVGSAGGEWAIRGFVASYDAQTGKQTWRWNSTDPKTYSGTAWKRGGAMVWTTPAVDPQLGLVVFSTGNPNPDLDGTGRQGDNLYSDSIVALDAKSGAYKWHYQEVKHDVWDYDAVSPVVFFDYNDNGTTIPAAGEAGKTGWFYIVDRRTGNLIKRSDAYVMQSKNMFSQPTKTGVVMLPGANGGAEWSPPAYSPKTKFAYVLGMDQLMNFTTQPVPNTVGALHLGSAFTNIASTNGGIQDGVFVAIDTQSGKIAWTHKTEQPLIGGALATAGNLVFMGEGNGNFDAFDAGSGKLLWSYNLGAGVNAPPITYSVGGEQYIAVAAGGNFQLNYPLGDAVAIFKLPKSK